MNKHEDVNILEKKQKGLIGVAVFLGFALIIGFFVYPSILHPQGENGTPEAPSDVEGTPINNGVSLTWTAPSDNGKEILKYYIKVIDIDKVETFFDTGSNDTSYTIGGLTNGDKYDFYVSAFNGNGQGNYSSPIMVIPEDVPQTIPTNVLVVGGQKTISVSWEAPSFGADEITAYGVAYRIKDSADAYTTAETESKNFTYEIMDLLESTEYEIYIYVKGGPAGGAQSELVFATTSAGYGGGELSFSDSPAVTTTSTTAQITWGTSKSASSQVYYGATDNFGSVTQEFNTTPRVTGHTVTLSNLLSCSVYVYKVTSFDSDANSIESVKGEFITDGCKGDATVILSEKGQVTANTGLTLDAKQSGRGLSVVVPADVVTGREVAIQALKVSKEEIQAEVSKPTGKTWVGGSYILSAIEDEITEVTSFDKSVTVSIDYQNADIEGVDPNTLKIWHYEDLAGWRELSSCSTAINSVGGTVTCQTTSFSVFGIFGESIRGSGSSTGSSGNIPKVAENNTITVSTPSIPVTSDSPLFSTENIINENNNFSFTKNLWLGVRDTDVKLLQRFLNLKGFTVSTDGPGSSGEETDFFGGKTIQALIKFQDAYKSNILTPIGLTTGTGFFGPQTRNFINSL